MKRQLSNTIHGLKFAMEKNDFERLNSSSGKKRNNILYFFPFGEYFWNLKTCLLILITSSLVYITNFP